MKSFAVALLAVGLIGVSPAPGLHQFGTADWQALTSAAIHAVAPDGRFLLNTVVVPASSSPLTVILNWTAALAK